jgi:hypothetical protein
MPRLRLVKVLVQPVFLLDDGETMTEIEHPVTAIPAAEWPTYSGERFPKEVAVWQGTLNAEAVEAAKAQPSPTRKTNPRGSGAAARREKKP